MARAELKYGHNNELRRLAQNIVAQQNHEISVMRAAVAGAVPTQARAPVSAHSFSMVSDFSRNRDMRGDMCVPGHLNIT